MSLFCAFILKSALSVSPFFAFICTMFTSSESSYESEPEDTLPNSGDEIEPEGSLPNQGNPRLRASFFDPSCHVLILQHFWECGTSIICFSTNLFLQYDIFTCPLPWHSLCFPEHWSLLKFFCSSTYVDPFGFVRRPGSWPGKVIYFFSHKCDEECLFEDFTDVWSYCPFDPVPLVPRPVNQVPPPSTLPCADPWLPVLTPGLPLWTLQRFWGVTLPYKLWWQANRTEYVLTTSDDSQTPRLMLNELVLRTLGRSPIQDLFQLRMPRSLSEFENLRYFDATRRYELR